MIGIGTDPWGFDEERQALARRLQRRRRRLSWVRTGVLVTYLIALLAGLSSAVRDWALSLHLPGWAASSVYLLVLVAIGWAIGWPFAYLGGFRLERSSGMSAQSLRSWFLDELKSFALGLGAVVVAGDVLLGLLESEPVGWWLLAWALGLVVTLVLGFLAPVVLAPLFYRFRPLKDPDLRSRFEALASRAGVPVLGVYEMGASRKTRRSNAAVMGFSRTRRIVITDTMLGAYTVEEIESVLAHELGHQRFLDPLKGVVVGALLSFVMWSVAAGAYAATWSAFGFRSLADMAGLPLLLLYSGLVSSALGPAELWWSRRREARADRFSLELTRNPAAFASAMVRLNDQNLGVAHPHAWEKWLLYSHPPGSERVDMARAFGDRHGPAA